MPQELMEKKVDDQKASEDTRWMKSYEMSLHRCKHGHYGERGIKFKMTQEDFKALWVRDKGHLLKQPSIDRINTADGYRFDNCRFIELSDNVNRPVSRNDGLFVQSVNLDGKAVDTFLSACQASRMLGVHKKSILWCLAGKRTTCAGFKWRIVSPTAKLMKRVGQNIRKEEQAIKHSLGKH